MYRSPCHDVLSSEHENDIENEIEIENENATILVLTILSGRDVGGEGGAVVVV